MAVALKSQRERHAARGLPKGLDQALWAKVMTEHEAS
jgi:hypothetical protein